MRRIGTVKVIELDGELFFSVEDIRSLFEKPTTNETTQNDTNNDDLSSIAISKKDQIMASYQRYAKYRDKKKLNDFNVCNATGIASATLYSWKTGVYMPKQNKLKTIAEFLGAPCEELEL